MRTDTASTFYVAGGTLRHSAPSYVLRQADEDLYEGLTRGEYCYVLTSRQMGKSSLMVHTAARLRQEGVTVALLDLTRIGQTLTLEQWYDGLLRQVGEHLDLEDELDEYWCERERLGPLERWVSALRSVVFARVRERIVIFIDEIDAVRSLTFTTDDFFAAIRECYNRRAQDPAFERLTFCLLGVASPSDLIQDTRTTPFNIGRRIELTDFTAIEAAPLTRGLGRDERTSASLLQRVLAWTSGHPYLTQRLCQAVAEAHGGRPETLVDQRCEALFLSSTARDRDDNLLFVRERLLRADVDRASLLDLYNQVRSGRHVEADETNALVSLLRLSGVVRVDRGSLRVRNQIYERVFNRNWIATHMPDAEIRRQQAAYRRGLVRASAASSMIVAIISGLAGVAVYQGRRADANARRADHNFYIASMNLAQQDWEGGNIARLRQTLAQTERDPERGFEWYYWERLCHLDRLTLRGHRGEVHAVAFSPDGRRVATGGYDDTARIWDAVTGREILKLAGHGGVALAVAFSPDGKRLVTGDNDMVARVWDSETGRQLHVLPYETAPGVAGSVSSVGFSPDGGRIVTGGPKGAVIWDATTGRQLLAFPGILDRRNTPHSRHSPLSYVSSVAFSPDSRRLVMGGDSASEVWDTTTGHQIFSLAGGGFSVCFSSDGRRIVTAGNGGTQVWDAATGRHLRTIQGRAFVFAAALSPDGGHVAIGDQDGIIGLRNALTGQEVLTLRGHTGGIEAVAFDPTGKWIVSGSKDGTARVWDATADRTSLPIRRHSVQLASGAFSPDSQRLAIGCWGGSETVWDLVSGCPLYNLRGHTESARTVVYSPDGHHILTESHDDSVSGSYDRLVVIWDAATGRQILSLRGMGYISPDGRLILIIDKDGTARLWDAVTARPLRTLRGLVHPPEADAARHEWVGTVAFSQSDQRLAVHALSKTAESDGRSYKIASGPTTLWDATTGRSLPTFALSYLPPESSLLLSRDGNRLFIHDQFSKTPVLVIKTTVRQPAVRLGRAVTSFALSPDEASAVTGSEDGSATMWDINTGRPLRTLRGHTQSVDIITFSPDGRRVVTGSRDGTARIWDVATGSEVLRLPFSMLSRLLVFSPNGRNLLVSDAVYMATPPEQWADWMTKERVRGDGVGVDQARWRPPVAASPVVRCPPAARAAVRCDGEQLGADETRFRKNDVVMIAGLRGAAGEVRWQTLITGLSPRVK